MSLVLVIRERRHKMTWAMLVPRKGTEFPWIEKRATKFIGQLGHNRVTPRCDNELAFEALARDCTIRPRRESDCAREIASCTGAPQRPESRPTQGCCAGLVEFAAYSMNRCGVASTERHCCKDYTGEGTTHRSWSFEKRSCTWPPNQREEESGSRGST